MTNTQAVQLIMSADLANDTDRLMIADILADRDRNDEARLCRDLTLPLTWAGGRIVVKQNEMVQAYLECALWLATDDEGESLDEREDIGDFTPSAIESAVRDCLAFARDNAADLADIDDAQAGHDFYLTRNLHGCGFWDRGLGEVGDRLTAAAHVYGDCDVYVGDDGVLHLS